MTPLPILLATKSFTGGFSSNSRLDVREVKTESVRALSRYFGMKFLSLEIWKKNLDVWPLSVENEALVSFAISPHNGFNLFKNV